MKASVLFLLLMFLFPFANVAQSEPGAEGKKVGDRKTVRVKSKLPWDWHLRSFEQDSVYGAAVYQAYDYLKDRQPKAKIVVAIIDGGAEVSHHNLKNALWRNPGEIPGNGIDDDNNGYVDDVHGWNFIGHSDGRPVHGVQIADAEFLRLREKYENADSSKLSKKEYKEYRYFKDAVCKFSKLSEFGKSQEIIDAYTKMINENRANRLAMGNDVNSMKNRHYGNNNLSGKDTFHGTHVAGIVGAVRGEERGIKGIASVELMIIKVLDDGDEEDKDVASAIYYAVDNGAKVINMSLTKYISFNRKFVYDAMRYAERKGVLIVKAAGNDSYPIDEYPCFPNQFVGKKKVLKNFICVGSSNASPKGYPSDFSNYGKKSVDIFAPGDFIFSTALGGKYRRLSGTSMAAPVVSGVAALIWNYFPELSASQVRQAILEGASSWKGRQVPLPGGNGETVDFGELCASGGILNALQAVKIAEQMSKK